MFENYGLFDGSAVAYHRFRVVNHVCNVTQRNVMSCYVMFRCVLACDVFIYI